MPIYSDKLTVKNTEGYMDLTAYHAMKGAMMKYSRGDVFSTKGDYDRLFMVLNSNEKYVTAVQLFDKDYGDVIGVEQMNGDGWYIDPARISYTYANNICDDEYEPIRKEDVATVIERISEVLGLSGKYDPDNENRNEDEKHVRDELEKISKLYNKAVRELQDSVTLAEHEELKEKLIKEQAKREVFEGLYKESLGR